MGRYLCTNLFSAGTLPSYCRLRFLIGFLRGLPRYARPPFCSDLSLNPTQLDSLQRHSFTQRARRRNAKISGRCILRSTSDHLARNSIREVRYLQAVGFCSSSNRSDFKASPPIGIIQESPTGFQWSALGARLGHSFNRLSRHINVYFQKKDTHPVPLAENASLLLAAPQYVSRLRKRNQSQKAVRDRVVFQEKDTALELKREDKDRSSKTPPEEEASPAKHSGVQLFHPSSLATRFGENYIHVANHVNTFFSRIGSSDLTIQNDLENVHSNIVSTRRQRKSNTTAEQKPRGQIDAEPDKGNTSSNIAEAYLLFASHINRYFGAKVEDNASKDQFLGDKPRQTVDSSQKDPSELSTSETQINSSQLHQEKHSNSKSEGLFHSSTNTTHFGESYLQMANHVNEYFNGPKTLEEDDGADALSYLRALESQVYLSQKPKVVSFVDCFLQPTSAIPSLLGGYLRAFPWAQSSPSTQTPAPPQAVFKRKAGLSRNEAEEMTYTWIGHLEQRLSPDDLRTCIETLNQHLVRYPSCKAVVWQQKTAVKMLKQRRAHRDHQELQDAIRETLALIGYVDPVKGRGIRVLSIDGGGTRGLVPLQLLKLLEAETGRPIHQLFDYICGVSTGAVLAFMLGLARFSLEECEDMYRRFGSDVFRQNPLVGTVKMGWSHSYYNTETWEKILRERMGEEILIRTSRDVLSPKVSAVSAVVNWGTSPKAFVFRNYNHRPGSLSRYAGSSVYPMWEAVRASSAAPGYFEEFTLQSDIHQDGGIILNNPCALAVHESRLLWPRQPFQCVLSLGTGRYDTVKRGPTTTTSWRAKISNLICSATDTEGVHTLLDDLLAPDVYFRFNPMLRAEVSLDESRPGVLDNLRRDTHVYLDRNRLKLARLCLVLGAERSAASHTKDWVYERAWEAKQRWV
ncbi:calcium-independent phospholipase A2-gamma isoform X1 [Gadus morhua]|uniref:Calcium-independent phospholipase A2-gamma-like n=1 Tax=Gadus morhua TaxID=8049 RepID=A0A8C5CT34_GADMO|nr:calcium-independent phospholipase A2-gamma-like isoform X1 [Gadus morhua]XP_030218424.1 calcium-independent phospholipase A2-gamma-like isoform X1 [Gadus morhua]XP_030218430.1 calcium-independent phospholipase A2-gamma-like isoform X1 [Gadus morhua]